jgi:hypothetical protein
MRLNMEHLAGTPIGDSGGIHIKLTWRAAPGLDFHGIGSITGLNSRSSGKFSFQQAESDL